MPKFIAKLADNKYVVWSTIVDSPTTYIMTRDCMLAYLDAEYGRSSKEENRFRMIRADKYGTSCMTPYSMEDLISSNRAGDNEEHASLEEILKIYDSKNAEDNGGD